MTERKFAGTLPSRTTTSCVRIACIFGCAGERRVREKREATSRALLHQPQAGYWDDTGGWQGNGWNDLYCTLALPCLCELVENDGDAYQYTKSAYSTRDSATCAAIEGRFFLLLASPGFFFFCFAAISRFFSSSATRVAMTRRQRARVSPELTVVKAQPRRAEGKTELSITTALGGEVGS